MTDDLRMAFAELLQGPHGPGRRFPARQRPDTSPRAVVGIFPRPMLATQAARPFSDSGWLYEVKWDGMRTLTHLSDGVARLYSRRGRCVTTQYPELTVLSQAIAASEALLDREIVH